MPDELTVWMRDRADDAEVVIVGSVVAENAWRIWRTLEAVCAMHSEVTVDLTYAASIDPTVLEALLTMRDDLKACDRRLTLREVVPTDCDATRDAKPPERASKHSVHARAVADITGRLHERFPLLPAEVVAAAVSQRYGDYGSASIREFLSILVEREAADYLNNLVA